MNNLQEILTKNLPNGIVLTPDVNSAVLNAMKQVADAKLIDEDYTHISICLDRSGSMQSISSDIIGGLNAFLASQREKPGKLTVSLSQFDDYYDKIYEFVDIKEVKDLTSETFSPRGMTALNDSFDTLITDTKDKIMNMGFARPGRVLFVSLTDGLENASKRVSKQQLADKIKLMTAEYNWVFSYIGAEQDSFSESQSRGMFAKDTMNFRKDSLGVKAMYSTLDNATSVFRSASMDVAQQSFNLSDEAVQPPFKHEQ